MKNAKQTDIDFVGKRMVCYKQELFLSIHFRGRDMHFAVSHRGNIFVLFENFRKPSYVRKADGITNFFNGEFGAAKQFFGFFDANLR